MIIWLIIGIFPYKVLHIYIYIIELGLFLGDIYYEWNEKEKSY